MKPLYFYAKSKTDNYNGDYNADVDGCLMSSVGSSGLFFFDVSLKIKYDLTLLKYDLTLQHF